MKNQLFMPTVNGRLIPVIGGPFDSADAAIAFMNDRIKGEIKNLRSDSRKPVTERAWVPGTGTHEEYYTKTIALWESVVVGAREVVRIEPSAARKL